MKRLLYYQNIKITYFCRVIQLENGLTACLISDVDDGTSNNVKEVEESDDNESTESYSESSDENEEYSDSDEERRPKSKVVEQKMVSGFN